MKPPAGVRVTDPDVGPESWLLPLGGGHLLVRFWAPEGREPLLTVAGPAEAACTPEALERAAVMLSAAAVEWRARRLAELRAETEPQLFDLEPAS